MVFVNGWPRMSRYDTARRRSSSPSASMNACCSRSTSAQRARMASSVDRFPGVGQARGRSAFPPGKPGPFGGEGVRERRADGGGAAAEVPVERLGVELRGGVEDAVVGPAVVGEEFAQFVDHRRRLPWIRVSVLFPCPPPARFAGGGELESRARIRLRVRVRGTMARPTYTASGAATRPARLPSAARRPLPGRSRTRPADLPVGGRAASERPGRNPARLSSVMWGEVDGRRGTEWRHGTSNWMDRGDAGVDLARDRRAGAAGCAPADEAAAGVRGAGRMAAPAWPPGGSDGVKSMGQ
jgi:hypothetical protein